ncbi:MAG: hypothetical protein MK188_09655 [Gammaproteobacteria bacterium]|nr:hypothetical protein [Gammaproteobacteria bacterium]
MQSSNHSNQQKLASEAPFDELMAELFTLITHHSLTQCENTLPKIIDRIHDLTQHDEIEYYPQQLNVLLKMKTLWHTRLFRSELAQLKH